MSDDYEYKYYLNDTNNEIYRLHVEPEDYPSINPREEFDGYCTKIYAENHDYNVSDELNVSSLEEAKQMIVSDANITVDDMIDYIRSGKSDYDLKYDDETEEWGLWGSFDTIFYHVEYGLYESQPDITWLEDAMVEVLDIKDLENISNGNLVVEPLCLTDYYYNPFLKIGTYRDGGFDGCIWITRESLEKVGYCLKEGETWEQALYKDLESELDEENRYLQGEVYGWIEEKCIDVDNPDDDDSWEEGDSCWGYIVDEDKVLNEEFSNLSDDMESLIKLREKKLKNIHIIMTETKKVDTTIKFTDKQFEEFKNNENFFTENEDGDFIYYSIFKDLNKGDVNIHYIASNEDSEDENENLYVIRTETR